jgi:fatty-acyl-CoA synthase
MVLVGRSGEPTHRASDGARSSSGGVPDDRWQERPLAAVVLRDGETACPKELREFLADTVVRWWLPERWTFVEQVPRTSVGKYDKKTIRTRHANGEYDVVEIHD